MDGRRRFVCGPSQGEREERACECLFRFFSAILMGGFMCVCVSVYLSVCVCGEGGGRGEEGPIYMCVGVGGVCGCVCECVGEEMLLLLY